MMDTAQLLLVIIVTVLTTFLIIIGLQVVSLLKELKKTIEKVNKILDDTGSISGNLAQPLEDLSGFFKMIGLLVDLVKDRKRSTTGLKTPAEMIPEEEIEERPEEKKTSIRRFFVRGGKKLA